MSTSLEVCRVAAAGLTERERAAFVVELGGPVPAKPERVLKQIEVARRLSSSVVAVANWRKQGLLVPVTLPGRTRILGYRESVVEDFMSGRTAKASTKAAAKVR